VIKAEHGAASDSTPQQSDEPEQPGFGTYQLDAVRDKVGKVVDHAHGTKMLLRPVDGGQEWEAEIADLTPVEPGEALRSAIRQINEGTHW
jgi:hypothetical protein